MTSTILHDGGIGGGGNSEDRSFAYQGDGHCFLLLLFVYFLDREEGWEKEREKNISMWLLLVHPPLETWPATQVCALTGNRTSDPLLHRLALIH